MSFVRPEAAQALLRWREVLVGLAVVGLGVWWYLGAFGIWRWVAVALIAAGGAITWEGIRRARFAPGSGGAGVVEVDERQITYFGPTEGRGGVDRCPHTRGDRDHSRRPIQRRCVLAV